MIEDFPRNVKWMREEIDRLRRRDPETPTRPESAFYRRKADRLEQILQQLHDFKHEAFDREPEPEEELPHFVWDRDTSLWDALHDMALSLDDCSAISDMLAAFASAAGERTRQVQDEHYTPAHDAAHTRVELSAAIGHELGEVHDVALNSSIGDELTDEAYESALAKTAALCLAALAAHYCQMREEEA